MKSIFTYPENPETDWIDPRYVGLTDNSNGWRHRTNNLLNGTYLSWPGLHPANDLGTTVSQLNKFQSKFINYLDQVAITGPGYDVAGPGYNLSMYNLHREPMFIGRKKLIDSEEVSAGTLVGPNNHVKLTFTDPHTFSDGDAVDIANFDGTMGFLPPLTFDVEVIDDDSIQLKDGADNYLRYYILEFASVAQAGEGATAAKPCVFTDNAHTLTDGTLVKMEGFDGTLNEHNGDQFYVQNTTATTFNLSYDAAGNDLLGYQVPAPNTPIVQFELLENGRIYVQLDITDLFDRTRVTFDIGSTDPELMRLQNELWQFTFDGEIDPDSLNVGGNTFAFEGNFALNGLLNFLLQYFLPTLEGYESLASQTPIGPYPEGVFLKNVRTAGDGWYEIHLTEKLDLPLNWIYQLSRRDIADRTTWYLATDDSGLIMYDRTGENRYANNTLFNVAALSDQFDGDSSDAQLVDKFTYNEKYYTDESGYVYTDSDLTTKLDAKHWRLPAPIQFYTYEKTSLPQLYHIATIKDSDGDVIDTSQDVVIDTTDITNQLDLIGLDYYEVQYDYTEHTPSTDSTPLNWGGGRTFNDDSDLVIYETPDLTPTNIGYTTTSWKSGEGYLETDYDLPDGQFGQFFQVRKWKKRAPPSTPYTLNPLYDFVADYYAANPNTPFVMGNSLGQKIWVMPYETGVITLDPSVPVNNIPYVNCWAYTIDPDTGNPVRPAVDEDFTDSNSFNIYDYIESQTALFNPTISNGVSDPITAEFTQSDGSGIVVGPYLRTFYSDTLLTSGTIITMDGISYAVFYIETDNSGTHTYFIYGWNGITGIDYTTDVPVQSPRTQTISTTQQTFFESRDGDHTGWKQNTLPGPDFTYYEYNKYYNGRRDVKTDLITSVPVTDSISGRTLDVVEINTIDSTEGTVTEVYTPEDVSQKTVVYQFDNATEGDVAISTSEPFKYELRNTELIMPGVRQYKYKDTNGDLQPGAQVEPEYFYEAGNADPVFIAGGSELPDLTVSVDSNGRITGTSMALKSGETTYGRFATDEDVCFPIKPADSTYVPPTTSDADAQDLWDTEDEWDDTGYVLTKRWPRHVTPSSATINLNSPTIVNRSQNGIKYSRKSSHTKWTLEVEYPPMTAHEFSEFHAIAQAAQGQAVPFYFPLFNKDKNKILWSEFMNQEGDTTRFRYLNNYAAGDKVLMMDGFASNETDAFREGEVFVGSGNENGGLHTVVSPNDANVYGEVKVRLAYPLRQAVNRSDPGYKDINWAIVTLNTDDFTYSIGTDGYYRLSVSFDLDGWK